MLTLLVFTFLIRVFASTFALRTIVMIAVVMPMAMWPILYEDQEILASLPNSMDPAFVSVWPLADEVVPLVVL
jgi:hypothetical protein